MSNLVKLNSRRVHSWKVLNRVENRYGAAYWLCVCICGNKAAIKGSQLTAGKSKKCKNCRSRKKPFEALYNKFKLSARHRVELSYKQFSELAKVVKCHYCTASITWAKFDLKTNGQGWNLDRKDSTKHYFKKNVVVCCKRCNRAKSNHFTYKEWFTMTTMFRTGG